jgi:hypothetical protein
LLLLASRAEREFDFAKGIISFSDTYNDSAILKTPTAQS